MINLNKKVSDTFIFNLLIFAFVFVRSIHKSLRSIVFRNRCFCSHKEIYHRAESTEYGNGNAIKKYLQSEVFVSFFKFFKFNSFYYYYCY